MSVHTLCFFLCVSTENLKYHTIVCPMAIMHLIYNTYENDEPSPRVILNVELTGFQKHFTHSLNSEWLQLLLPLSITGTTRSSSATIRHRSIDRSSNVLVHCLGRIIIHQAHISHPTQKCTKKKQNSCVL